VGHGEIAVPAAVRGGRDSHGGGGRFDSSAMDNERQYGLASVGEGVLGKEGATTDMKCVGSRLQFANPSALSLLVAAD
jgi:hypothetical protein